MRRQSGRTRLYPAITPRITRCPVRLQVGKLSLMIRDDGVGFDSEETSAANHRGLGLAGMCERAALVGGSLEIESAPGAGVNIFARVPITDYEEGGAPDVQRYDSKDGQYG